MKLNPDSPEITAFALGELPPASAAEVAAQVAADPALQAEVDAIRMMAGTLSAQFAAEPAPELSADQRARIELASAETQSAPIPAGRSGAGSGPGAVSWLRWLLQPGWGVAGASLAALCLALVIWPRVREAQEAEFESLRYGPVPKPTLVSNAAPRVEAEAAQSVPASVPSLRQDPQPAPQGRAASVPTPTRAPVPQAPRGQSVPVSRGGQPAPVQTPVSAPTPRSSKVRAQSDAPDAVAAAAAPSAAGPAGAGQPGLEMEPAYLKRSIPAAPAPTLTSPAEQPARRYARDMAGVPVDAYSEEARKVPVAGGRALSLMRASGETYRPIVENPFRPVVEARLSTFGLDVDTASYANIRRFLRDGVLPPADAVRIEEMINYFPYTQPAVSGDHPVEARVDVTESPWRPGNRLVRVTVKARDVARAERPAANLVFLVDVSGSMEPENKLPLVKQSLRLVAERLGAKDRVSIVTYAGDAGVALAPSNGAEKGPILAAIDRLRAGGSTHGSAGIRLAYALARTNLVAEGVNRVILCTDGDFNVGVTSQTELFDLIAEEAKAGVALTVLGYGMGNYNDATTEILADRGNGAYAYIDSFREAGKVLSSELESTLVTVAQDVKLQIEFNPARVVSSRLIGYENRVLADRDFNDDTKDAGDLGAGHVVTALYEIVPVGGVGPGVDPLRYEARPAAPTAEPVRPGEMLFVKIRYKQPGSDRSRLFDLAVKEGVTPWAEAAVDTRFAAAVAGFGMLLRDSAHKGNLTWDAVAQMAERSLGEDPGGYRAEFVDLVRRAKSLRGGR